MLDITWYMVECALRFVERFGFLLVQRDPVSGEFLGAIGLIPPYKKYWRCLSHYRLAALTLGRVNVPERRGCPRRYKAYQKTTQEVQRESLLTGTDGLGHWSIPIVGVASQAQKQGVGRVLVETATRLCPRPIYVSVSEDRVHFFEKCGFMLEKRFMLAAEGNNSDPENDIIYYNAMNCL
jgi:GNAT superfamily N-acetyltransferase